MYEYMNYMDKEATSRRSSMSSGRSEESEAVKSRNEVDSVRVVPPTMVFRDAYDGKVFNQSLSIINCGKYPAFVRILAPTSKAFKMKAIPKGYTISSGLSINRTITYTHTSAMALPRACLFIYVNDKPILYKLEVYLVSARVTLNPKSLDFGEVDAGTVSRPMTLHLCNEGHKITHFWVDLGRNNLELIVEPMRGTIRPLEDVEITVEVLGSKLGSFTKEFWIKTDPPQRVNISGTFIKARIIVEHPISPFKFVLLDFPRVYLGAHVTRTLVIRNNSSSATMFCIVSDCGTGFEYLKTATATSNDLKCFRIVPREGRLQAQQTYILQFTFSPKTVKHFPQLFSIAFLSVAKVEFRDEHIVDEETEAKTFRTGNDSTTDIFAIPSLQAFQEFYADDDEEEEVAEMGDDYLRICLYGEMEEAKVRLTPESFSIAYLRPNIKYNYELNVKNMSEHLPIVFKYNKTACVEVEPKKITLGPTASTEILLSIKPSKMGETCINVLFDLIYESKQEPCKVGIAKLPLCYVASMACPYIEPQFNMGITPRITNEVGFMVDDVRYNSPVKKPIQAIVDDKHVNFNKNNDDLIAFPNDRPTALRPWKSDIPCRTIFANIPRFVNKQDEYAMNDAELDMKKYTNQVYVDYFRSEAQRIRQKQKPPPALMPHYMIAKEKRILMEGVYFSDCTTEKSMSELFGYTGIPLPPERLLAVKIRPKTVALGKIAPYTTCTDSFSIENNNEFAIRVFIKALSNSIVIKGTKLMIIEPKTTKNIFFDCWSYGLGKYYVPVFIIVNDCHVFDANVFAKVVPTTVVCPSEEIIIDPMQNMSFFEIFNPVNCDISFSWEVQDDNYDMYPLSGTIPSRKSLFCRLTFLPQINAVYRTEVYLLSQNGVKQIIRVIRANDKPPVAFDTSSVKFENSPLNIPVTKELILRNFSDTEIVFYIKNPHPVAEITISPSKGKVYPKSDAFFEIVAHFKNIVSFNCQLDFLLQDEYRHIIDVEGNVVFPAIQMEPESIQIPKIVTGSYRRRVFKLTNKSEAQSSVDFSFEDFPELRVTDLHKHALDSVFLNPGESRELFLEFRPLEATAYSLFLPFVINGVIGPPALNDPKSIIPKTYFEVLEDEFHTAIELPENVPIIRLRCAAAAPWLYISSLEIDFQCRDMCTKHLIIRNISSQYHQITIPLLEEHPFNYEIQQGSMVDKGTKYYEILMESKEEVVIDFTFDPTEYGEYNMELPLFVDKPMDPCPYNYLHLFATYSKPLIVCNKNILFFQTIPVKNQVSGDLFLELTYHKKDCVLSMEVFDETISVKLSEKTEIDIVKSRIDFTVTFTPKEECCVETKVFFNCSCEESFTLVVKTAANNSFFECYEEFMKSKALIFMEDFESTFPRFPKLSDSYYAAKMNLMLGDVESWMYSQAFFFKNFFKIPVGMSRFPPDITRNGTNDNKKLAKKQPEPQLPLVKLLINLMGPSIVQYFEDSSLKQATEGIEGAIYLYSTYRNILSFLKSQDVFVQHLEPEYLLPYKLYVTFREQIDHLVDHLHQSIVEKILTKKEFLSLSTQCWLDLLLRIYKRLVLDRTVDIVVVPTSRKKSDQKKQDIYYKDFLQYFQENKGRLQNRCEIEVKLLMWIQFHYENQKGQLWDLSIYEHLLKPRRFTSFEIDMWDGLAFATLLVAYCPYLKKHLQNFYPAFENEEQMFHNFCIIHQVMSKINLSYILTPPHLVRPSTAEMIIMVAYLYEVLPGLLPVQTITLEASLGDSISHEILLKNTGNFAIAYTPIFFKNKTNDFEVNSECVIINPKKQAVIKITYIAKSILKKTSTLLLSGETIGFKYARSTTVSLVGIPKILDFTDEYTFKVETFTPQQKSIDICSPYEKAYVAKLYMCKNDQTKIPQGKDDFVPVASYVEHCVPRQICVDPECTFDDSGTATLPIKFQFVCCGRYSFFIYFLNEDVGDFCVKVNICSEMHKKNIVDVDVILPTYFSTEISCTCAPEWLATDECQCYDVGNECPKMIAIYLPYINHKLIEALRLMLNLSVDPTEFTFWNSLLDTPKGFHVYRSYLDTTFMDTSVLYRRVLDPKVTYMVEISKKKINFPRRVTIQDVTASGHFRLPLHWNIKDEPTEEILKLCADHGQEIRQYRLCFKRQQVINNM